MSHADPLLIWGAGGHALVVSEIASADDRFAVHGFVDDINPERKGQLFAGHAIVGAKEELANCFALGIRHIVIAIGDCDARLSAAAYAKAIGFQFPTLRHSSAIVSPSARLGEGTVLMAGAIINAAAVVGCHAIINTAATVDHECVLEDGVHISPGAHLGGRVTVGASGWIGIGAAVRHGIQIGARAVVGAGAVVVKPVPEAIVVVGSPARPLKNAEKKK